MIQKEFFLQEQYGFNLGITGKTTTGSHKCFMHMPKHKSCKYFREKQLYLPSLNHQFPQYCHHFVPLLLLHITDAFRRQKVYGMVYKAWDFQAIRVKTQQSRKHFTWSTCLAAFSCFLIAPAAHYPSSPLPAFAYPRCHGFLQSPPGTPHPSNSWLPDMPTIFLFVSENIKKKT